MWSQVSILCEHMLSKAMYAMSGYCGAGVNVRSRVEWRVKIEPWMFVSGE